MDGTSEKPLNSTKVYEILVPDDGVHVLQIEVDRALYMDEERIEPTDNPARVPVSATQVSLQGTSTNSDNLVMPSEV